MRDPHGRGMGVCAGSGRGAAAREARELLHEIRDMEPAGRGGLTALESEMKGMAAQALEALAAAPAPALDVEVLVAVCDMALRYSVISHDYGCPERLDPFDPRYEFKGCTCPAKGYRDRSITLIKEAQQHLGIEMTPAGEYARLAAQPKEGEG